MGLLNFKKSLANNSAVANSFLAINLKKGKTEDQCKCIDFFLGTADTQAANSGCGCLKKAVSGGWSIDDYCAHVDKIVNSLNLKQRAIEKIGLDESQISEIPPILLSSFRRGENLYYKTNANHTKFVTNKYSVTWIFFSATQIYTYTYEFDTTSDNSLENTRDFFYSDVTCIRTEHEVEENIYEVNAKGCGCSKPKESKYVHQNRHWDTLQITVPSDSYSFYCRTNETIEQSIQAAKAMIREKKQA